jgi:hypothetical protein
MSFDARSDEHFIHHVMNTRRTLLGRLMILTVSFALSGGGVAAQAGMLFFYKGPGSVIIPGAQAASFAGTGIFTPVNTVYFSGVPVADGKVTGSFGDGVTVIYGMTIAAAPSPLGLLGIARGEHRDRLLAGCGHPPVGGCGHRRMAGCRRSDQPADRGLSPGA